MLVLNSQNIIIPLPLKCASTSMLMYFIRSGLVDTSTDFMYGLTAEEFESFILLANKFDREAANNSLCNLRTYTQSILTEEEEALWKKTVTMHASFEDLTTAYPDLDTDNKTFVMAVRHPIDRIMSAHFFIADGYAVALPGQQDNTPEDRANITLNAVNNGYTASQQQYYLPPSGTTQLFRVGGNLHNNVSNYIQSLGGSVSGEWRLRNNATRERDYTKLLSASTISALEVALSGEMAVWNAGV